MISASALPMIRDRDGKINNPTGETRFQSAVQHTWEFHMQQTFLNADLWNLRPVTLRCLGIWKQNKDYFHWISREKKQPLQCPVSYIFFVLLLLWRTRKYGKDLQETTVHTWYGKHYRQQPPNLKDFLAQWPSSQTTKTQTLTGWISYSFCRTLVVSDSWPRPLSFNYSASDALLWQQKEPRAQPSSTSMAETSINRRVKVG